MAVSEKTVECDLLVIGGGLAGTHASIRARQSNKDLNVTLVDKGYVSMSGASSFAGGYSAVFDKDLGHNHDIWKNHILRMGEYINDQDWVDLQLQNTWNRYEEMISWGVPFAPDESGKPKQFPIVNNISNIRILSQKFMPVIRKKALESGVKIVDRVMITDLLKQDGRIVGAVGFHRDGDFYVFKSKATIVSTGQGGVKGPGYPHDYWTGDGEGMCYRVGLGLSSREFNQQCEYIFRKYPALFTVISKANKVNAEGDLFAKTYYEVQGTPDRLHKAQMFEAHAGRAPTYLDFTGCSTDLAKEEASIINRMFVRERLGHDILSGKHEILWGSSVGSTGPAAGGVVINTKCETELPGLYAAGDTAGTNLSGSLYPGVGFGLTTATVSGYIAGESAANYCASAKKPEINPDEIARLRDIACGPLNRKGGFRSSWVTQVIQGIMVPYFIMGVKREDRMLAALTLITFVREHLVPLTRAEDPHELRMAHEVRNMALNSEMVLRASLFRTESRGLHYREDYPNRDDANWLAWTVLREEGGEMKVHKQPLPEKWHPDPSQTYEERYDFRFPKEERTCR
jgi:succinate dehydrogenase/fumarate reductase flavoprotein subunit